jgi:hypothetical protein
LDWYLQPWQLTITVLVCSVKGSRSASTPVTLIGMACTTRVLRCLSVPESIGAKDWVNLSSDGEY